MNSTQMGTCIQDKRKISWGMERENICMEMEVITMEIGSKGKWKVKVSYMILMEIFNMKGSGRMICTMERELCMDWQMWIGLSMLEISKLVKWRVLERWSLRMEINTKGNLETIILGEREECSWKMAMSR